MTSSYWLNEMITTDLLLATLGWCTLINMALLVFSTVVLVAGKSSIARIHGKLLGVGDDHLEQAYFQYLANYKLLVLVFNLVPYLSLRLALS